MKEKDIDLLVGLIIGDGCITQVANSYQLHVGHGQSQADYCQWKLKLLNDSNIFSKKIKYHTKLINNKYIQCYFGKASKKMSFLFDLFRPNGEKKTIKNVLSYLKSNRSVAIWFMDDGGIEPCRRRLANGEMKYYNPNLKLCTHSFSYEDQLLIRDFFKRKYQIDCNIRIEKKKRNGIIKQYYFLRFNSENTEKVYRKILKEYIHCCKSMEYKFKHLLCAFEGYDYQYFSK